MILFNMEFESNFVVHWSIEKIAYKGLLCALIHLLNNIKIFSNKKLFMLLFFFNTFIYIDVRSFSSSSASFSKSVENSRWW